MNISMNNDDMIMNWADQYISEVIEECHVPGAAVAILKDGEVIFKKGYGCRDIGDGLPVNVDTLFPIGSITKSFTTMALSLLYDDGKFDWNTPIKDYLPNFKLDDAYATEKATSIDLASHRTGLPRHDFIWYKSEDSLDEIFHKLRYLPLSKDFRTTFQYQSLTYIVLGYLSGKISGSSWEELIRSRIFAPLKMERANISIDTLKNDANSAKPYRYGNEKSIELPYLNTNAIAPAGGINASINALIPWVKLHLSSGSLDGAQFISRPSINRMHQPHMVAGSHIEPEIVCPSYGLGWQIAAYKGHVMVHHGGNINGFSAKIDLIPEKKLGLVVLCNQDTSLFPIIVGRAIIDKLLGLEDANWKQRLFEKYNKMLKATDMLSSQIDAECVNGTMLSHPLEAFAGKYEHLAYGRVTVTLQEDQLLLKAPFMDKPAPLQHYHFDVFILKTDIGIRDLTLRVPFYTNVQGNIEKLSMRLEPSIDRIEFKRIVETQEYGNLKLDLLVGEYQSSLGICISIGQSTDTLTLTIPGQPCYELVNQGSYIFQLKGLKGFLVQFHIEEKEMCSELTLTQPNGVFKLTRKV